MSRTDVAAARTLREEALERVCVSAYPKLVSEAYENLLASRAIDPLARIGRPATVASAEGASLLCRMAWLRLRAPDVRLHMEPCNEYHVCTLLDAALRPFASVGTRTAGNGRQELTLHAPSGTVSATYDEKGIICPTELIAVLTHHVRFGRDADGSPFRIEDRNGASLVDFEGPIEAVDAVGHVESLDAEQYVSDALDACETRDVPTAGAIEKAVRKSRAAVADAARASLGAKGWTVIDHFVRDRSIEQRAAAVHAGYFTTEPHDVLEFVTHSDASGEPLDGARPYVVRFERWNEPPAHASWFLHVAPAAQARVDLVRADPATSIMLGPTAPYGTENWIETLPQPVPLEVRLILCWPSERARSEIWMPPDIVRLN